MCPEMIEVDRKKFKETLESLQRKVPRLCRLSFERAFEVAIAIEIQKGVKSRETLFERLRERWTFKLEEQAQKSQQKDGEKVAYLRALQKEALEYYDGKREGEAGEESDARGVETPAGP